MITRDEESRTVVFSGDWNEKLDDILPPLLGKTVSIVYGPNKRTVKGILEDCEEHRRSGISHTFIATVSGVN
jgi:hypothetical protein